MKDADIIDALVAKLDGKLHAVAARLGGTSQSVWNWRERGIAWPSRGAVADLANELGVDLPEDFLRVKRTGRRKARAA